MEVIMKTKNAMFLAVTAVLLGITACNEEPKQEGALAPEYYTVVIKFDKPEYKEHIMVYSARDAGETTRLCTDYLAYPDSVIHLCGQSPYIELPSDYLLIDWKWGRIYYPNNEAIVNSKWSELKTIDDEFPVDEISVEGPVIESYFIPISQLKAYNNDLEHDSLGWPEYYSDREWATFSDEARAYELSVKKMKYDSAFAEYAKVITDMINAGDLEKLPESCKAEINR